MHIDPTSDRVVLRYVGDGRPVSGAPTRDLTHSDIARITYRRSLAEVAQDVGQPIDREHPKRGVIERPNPRRPDQKLAAALLEELGGTHQFAPPEAAEAKSKAPRRTPAKSKSTPAATEAPAAPAQEA